MLIRCLLCCMCLNLCPRELYASCFDPIRLPCASKWPKTTSTSFNLHRYSIQACARNAEDPMLRRTSPEALGSRRPAHASAAAWVHKVYAMSLCGQTSATDLTLKSVMISREALVQVRNLAGIDGLRHLAKSQSSFHALPLAVPSHVRGI